VTYTTIVFKFKTLFSMYRIVY